MREFLALRGLTWRVLKDLNDVPAALESMEMFPVRDVMDALMPRVRFIQSDEFRSYSREHVLPNLERTAVMGRKNLPQGTLGQEFAQFTEARELEMVRIHTLDPRIPFQYYALLTAALHNLFHFILEYEVGKPCGEMEIEAFLFAQTRAPSHIVFLMAATGHVLLRRPWESLHIAKRLLNAFRRGKRAKNLLLVRWVDQFTRPTAQLRIELGLTVPM